jgi:hypothetical protein
MDEFNFGPRGRSRRQVGIDPRLLMVVGGLLVVALAVVGFLTFVSRGGHQAAEAQVTAVQQIDHSQDAAAQSSLRNAMVAAKTLFTDAGTYDGLGPADLTGVEPSLTYTDGPSPDAQTVSVALQGSTAGMAAMSPSGTCFYIKDDPAAGGVTFGSGTICTGQAALGAATGASW